ncbi:probable pectinesterase/pectinesterase inhibitor 12 [Phalaenopsis equestris]|uniref:probable pectinesterase/pectinesterase inhibitor 12 n=1 Tax=Phalaenopsis equestris TaxID=78828 RepID=UPI0009E1BD62|nr:probable pectinesterase/pectinesterase inhibitor 12 [Phalaenopsis equestris]
MASSPIALLLILFLFFSRPSSATPTTNNSSDHQLTICKSTPFPKLCLDSLKLSISISINPTLLSILLHSLESAVSAVSNISPLLSSHSIFEAQRGALQDCGELHSSTLSSLHRSSSLLSSSTSAKAVAEAQAHLSASLTNKETCLEGLAGARGAQVPALVNALTNSYRYVSNSLSLVSSSSNHGRRGRKLEAEPSPGWLRTQEKLLLDSGDYSGYDTASVLTVAADGSGNFSTVGEAVAFAPNNSADLTIIVVRSGVYNENVEIPNYKTNIALLGEGSDATFIKGNRSVGDGWTTFRSATVAVSGQGFLARDLTFQNTAGPTKGQAVALRINADFSAVYLCTIDGYQDTLYVHSFRQFYRETHVFGTVDFIFGNAAAVFQACNLIAKKPMPGQSNIVTAQSRDDPNESTGISIQNCSVLASEDLASDKGGTKTYLGRPWRLYSTTVFIESFIDGHVDPAGWTKWSQERGEEGLDTLYYGEYMNFGPGAATENRVAWPGFHLMEYDDAYNFTVSEFIYGDMWLDFDSVPYDDGI